MADEIQIVPLSYHYQGMGWVILILVCVLSMIVLTSYFIGRKKEWTFKKRGLIIGLVFGIIWSVISGIGSFKCGWTLFGENFVPSGICSNWILLYVFFLPSLFPLALFSFSLVGLYVGWIIGKVRGSHVV